MLTFNLQKGLCKNAATGHVQQWLFKLNGYKLKEMNLESLIMAFLGDIRSHTKCVHTGADTALHNAVGLEAAPTPLPKPNS
jgi:hypothetical protein